MYERHYSVWPKVKGRKRNVYVALFSARILWKNVVFVTKETRIIKGSYGKIFLS